MVMEVKCLDQKHLNSLKDMEYVSLTDNQEGRLKELEQKFNDEFGLDCYFLVMKRK
jgi:hypothetical protein